MSSSCFSSKVSHWVFSWVTCCLLFQTVSPPQITLPCILPLHLACPRVHEEYQCPPAADWHSRVGWTMNEKADAAALQCIHKWWSHISWICRGKYFTWSLQRSTLQSNQKNIILNILSWLLTYLHTLGHQTLQSAECLALTFCKSCRIFPLLIKRIKTAENLKGILCDCDYLGITGNS